MWRNWNLFDLLLLLLLTKEWQRKRCQLKEGKDLCSIWINRIGPAKCSLLSRDVISDHFSEVPMHSAWSKIPILDGVAVLRACKWQCLCRRRWWQRCCSAPSCSLLWRYCCTTVWVCREKWGGMGAEYRRYFSVSPVIWPGLLPLYERKVSVLWGNLTWSSVSTEGAAALSRSGCRAQGSRGLRTGYVRVTSVKRLPADGSGAVLCARKGMQLVATGTIVFEDIPCILKFVNQSQLWCLTSKGLWWGWAWPSIWKWNWSNIESLEMVTPLWRLLFYERCFEGIHSLWNEFMLFILPLTEQDIIAVTHDCCHLSNVHYIPVRLRIQHLEKYFCMHVEKKKPATLYLRHWACFSKRLVIWHLHGFYQRKQLICWAGKLVERVLLQGAHLPQLRIWPVLDHLITRSKAACGMTHTITRWLWNIRKRWLTPIFCYQIGMIVLLSQEAFFDLGAGRQLWPFWKFSDGESGEGWQLDSAHPGHPPGSSALCCCARAGFSRLPAAVHTRALFTADSSLLMIYSQTVAVRSLCLRVPSCKMMVGVLICNLQYLSSALNKVLIFQQLPCRLKSTQNNNIQARMDTLAGSIMSPKSLTSNSVNN